MKVKILVSGNYMGADLKVKRYERNDEITTKEWYGEMLCREKWAVRIGVQEPVLEEVIPVNLVEKAGASEPISVEDEAKIVFEAMASEVFKKVEDEELPEEEKEIPLVKDLKLTAMIKNVLVTHGITTVAELEKALEENTLINIEEIGIRGFRSIKKALGKE